MKSDPRRLRQAVQAQMRRQHGVITRRQVHELGGPDSFITQRLGTGEWLIAHRGVYRLAGVAVWPEQRMVAACLAAGTGAVVSHSSAAWLWGLLDHPPDLVSVTVSGARHPRIAGVDIHRSDDLAAARLSRRRGVACTGPLRTIVDMAAVVSRAEVDSVVDRALATKLITLPALRAELSRLSRRGRRGVLPLRASLHARGFVGAPHPSVLESRMLRLLVSAGIEPVGAEIIAGDNGEYRLDFALDGDLVVEVDGYVWHFSPEHKQRDDHRRNELRVAGKMILVYSWVDVTTNPGKVVAQIIAARSRQKALPG